MMAGRPSQPGICSCIDAWQEIERHLSHLLALDNGLPIKLGFSESCRAMAHSRHQLALTQQLSRLILANVTGAWKQSPHCA